MDRMRLAFEGTVYQIGPDLWGLMNLPRDHSAWARSVRWSCGRPGFDMPDLRLYDDGYRQAMGADLACRMWATVFTTRVVPDLRITGL